MTDRTSYRWAHAQALHAAGFRATATRLRLLEVIQCHPGLSVTELAPYLALEGIDITNLYRNVKPFERAGLVQRVVELGEVRLRLAKRTIEAICTGCGFHMPLASADLTLAIQNLMVIKKWHHLSYQLTIHGACRGCQLGVRRVAPNKL